MIPLDVDRPFLLPLVPFRVPAGFPSPALDFDCKAIDLHALLIGNAPATFLWRLSGWSMRDLGLGDGDLLIVDRSLKPQHGDIVVAEPNALIGFAGPRVIEQTVREVLPEGFQRAEFLLEKGAIDQIIDRRMMKDQLSELITLLRRQDSVSSEEASVA